MINAINPSLHASYVSNILEVLALRSVATDGRAVSIKYNY